MLFMSGSVKGRASNHGRQEFIFAGPSGPFAEGDEDLRSERFDRRGALRRNRKIPEEVMVTHLRGSDAPDVNTFPCKLSSIAFDQIRLYHNLEAYPYAFESDLDVLQWACALAGESPTARMLLKVAQSDGWCVRMDDLGHEGYAIDEEAQAIVIDHYGFTAIALGRSAYFRNALFVAFVKALRQVWHERQDYGYEATHRPDAILMIERARAADCETVAILAGWELRASGHTDIWRSILGAEEGDMAMIFTRAIEKDPAGFYDGSVLARTFCQWYGDESRIAVTDHATLERMDERLEDAQGAQVFGSCPLRRDDIERLSALPQNRGYLEGMGADVCTDPYFASLGDTINETHLFQVIYESRVVMVEGVPFRDRRLASLIFPGVKTGAAQ